MSREAMQVCSFSHSPQGRTSSLLACGCATRWRQLSVVDVGLVAGSSVPEASGHVMCRLAAQAGKRCSQAPGRQSAIEDPGRLRCCRACGVLQACGSTATGTLFLVRGQHSMTAWLWTHLDCTHGQSQGSGDCMQQLLHPRQHTR